MSEPLTPALTPEEWAEALAWPHGLKDYVVRPAERLGYGENEPSDMHRVAALALHGQRFGPTWDMVDVLREVGQYRMLTHRESEGIASVVAFVQALLPPRVDDVPQAEE